MSLDNKHEWINNLINNLSHESEVGKFDESKLFIKWTIIIENYRMQNTRRWVRCSLPPSAFSCTLVFLVESLPASTVHGTCTHRFCASTFIKSYWLDSGIIAPNRLALLLIALSIAFTSAIRWTRMWRAFRRFPGEPPTMAATAWASFCGAYLTFSYGLANNEPCILGRVASDGSDRMANGTALATTGTYLRLGIWWRTDV